MLARNGEYGRMPQSGSSLSTVASSPNAYGRSLLASVADWYAYAMYIPAFLFGYLTARSDAIWMRMGRVHWRALAGALPAS